MTPPSSGQALITGVYRTGSEFLAQLIGCHPGIAVSMYSVNVLRFAYGRYDPIEVRANYVAALADTAARMKERYERDIDTAAILRDLDGLEKVDYGAFYDVLMRHIHLKPPATQWAEKNQLLWREIPAFLDMMPSGRAILILRDPRSVLVSFRQYTYAPSPAYLGAIFNCFDAMVHAKRLRQERPDRVLVVRYEDVAAAPQRAAEQCWDFLGLEGRFDVTAGADWLDAYGRPWHANSSFHGEDDRRPFDIAASRDRWRNRIGDAELHLTEGVCGDLMQEFGYSRAVEGAIDWPRAMKLFIESPLVLDYFRHWLNDGEGIQAFPTDPLKPENWRND